MSRFLLCVLCFLLGVLVKPATAQDRLADTIFNEKAPETSIAAIPAAVQQLSTQATTNSPFGLSEMIWIMLSCGLLGGLANYLRTIQQVKNIPDPIQPANQANEINIISSVSDKPSWWSHLLTCLMLGVVASALVPLFLNSLESDLLRNRTDLNLLIFAGFCLLAAISSSSFIDALTQRILNQMKTIRDQTITEANRVEQAKQETETLLETVRSEQESLRADRQEVSSPDAVVLENKTHSAEESKRGESKPIKPD